MKNGILVDWATVGATLANTDENEQAAFFTAFCKEMRTWPTQHQQEMQLIFVNGKLSADHKELLSALSYKEPTV